MEIKSTINIILKDLEEARGLIDDLKNYPGVPLLQVELAKAKCRSAEDVIKLLSDLPDNYFVSSDSSAVTVKTEKSPPKQESEPALITDDSQKHDSVIITEQVVRSIDNPDTLPETGKDKKIDEEKADRKEKISKLVDEIVNVKDREPAAQKKDTSKKIVADKFSNLQGSINDRAGVKMKDEGQSEKHLGPVSDLTRAIGINDRFLYIRELFDGNKEKFSMVISELNHVNSVEEAAKVISRGSGSDSDNEAFGQLIELVKRKLATGNNG